MKDLEVKIDLSPPSSTNYWTAHKMIRATKPRKGDVLLDSGSGEGDVLFVAAEPQYGFQNIWGIECRGYLVEKSRKEAESRGLGKIIKILHKDILAVGFSDLKPKPTIVTLNFTGGGLGALRPKLEEELELGTRVVSFSREVPGWRHEEAYKPEYLYERFFLYEIGKT